MKKTLFRVLSFVLLLSLLAIFPRTQTAGGQGSGAIQIVLLIDSSGSTATTDPDNLRIWAAYFLLDYVQAVGATRGVTHSFAVANFNGNLIDPTPLQPLQGDVARTALIARSVGGTDFGPALEYAWQQRQNADQHSPMAVVLFTDGRPDPAPDLTAYFQALAPTLDQLIQSGAQIFVVAVGDTAEDRQQWVNLITADHYRSVDATTDLAGVYHDFLAEMLGLSTETSAALTGGSEHIVTVEPYLEQVVFAVVKDELGARVTVRDPNGATVPPVRGGTANELHAVYSIAAPRPGEWRIQVDRGAADLWVDRRWSTLALEVPPGPQASGAILNVTGRLLRNGEPIVDSNLSLQVETMAPDGERAATAMQRQADGRYTAALTHLQEAGTYTLTLSAQLAGAALRAQTTPVMVTLFPVPAIVTYDVLGDPVVSHAVTATALITNADRLGTEANVLVRVESADGGLLGSVEMRDDGERPDDRAGDGRYAGTVTLPAIAGRYRFQWIVQGRTVDGVTIAASTPWTWVEVRPAVTITPGPTSTPPPFDFPAMPPRRYQWWVIGLAIGLLAGAGATTVYLLRRYGPQVRNAEQLREENRRLKSLDEGLRRIAELKAEAERLVAEGKLTKASDTYSEAIECVTAFFTDAKDQAIAESTELYRDWLEALATDPDQRQKIIREQAKSKERIALAGLARALTDLWSVEGVNPVTEFYDNLLLKEANPALLDEFARIEHNPLSNFAKLACEARRLQQEGELTPESLEGLIEAADKLPDGHGLKEAYKALAALMRSIPPDKPTSEFEEAEKQLCEHGPNYVLGILRLVDEALTLPQGENDLEQLDKACNHLETCLGRMKQKYCFMGDEEHWSPEAFLFRAQIQRWKVYVDNQIARAEKPGELDAEVVSSLDIDSAEENKREDGAWEICLPIRLTNVGNRPITDIEVWLSVGPEETKPDFKPVPNNNNNKVERLEGGTSVVVWFSFTTYDVIHISIGAKYQRPVPGQRDPDTCHLRRDNVLKCGVEGEREITAGLPNPYIPDRPLIGTSEWEAFGKGRALNIVDRIMEELRRGTGRIIAIHGLRRTGKTSTLLRALARADTELKQEGSERPQFLVIYLDLLAWLERLPRPTRRGKRLSLEALLWREILSECSIVLEESDIPLSAEVEQQMQQAITAEGGITLATLRETLARLKEETGMRPLLVIDEADSFADPRLEQDRVLQAVATGLRTMVQRDGLMVLLAHDIAEASWERYFFDVEGRRPSPGGVVQPIFLRLRLLERNEVNDLIRVGPLEWTDLALQRAWRFTGGYQALVQLLAYYLVERKNQAKALADRRGDPKGVSLVVTSDDVARAVGEINNSADWEPFVDYLRHGFRLEETRFLMALAVEYTNLHTTRIRGIRWKDGAWEISDAIQKAFSRYTVDIEKDPPDSPYDMLQRLMSKEILTASEIDHLLEWRVGWLCSLLRQLAQERGWPERLGRAQ